MLANLPPSITVSVPVLEDRAPLLIIGIGRLKEFPTPHPLGVLVSKQLFGQEKGLFRLLITAYPFRVMVQELTLPRPRPLVPPFFPVEIVNAYESFPVGCVIKTFVPLQHVCKELEFLRNVR